MDSLLVPKDRPNAEPGQRRPAIAARGIPYAAPQKRRDCSELQRLRRGELTRRGDNPETFLSVTRALARCTMVAAKGDAGARVREQPDLLRRTIFENLLHDWPGSAISM